MRRELRAAGIRRSAQPANLNSNPDGYDLSFLFGDLDYPAYSIPLSAIYMPLSFMRFIDQRLVGEIAIEDIDYLLIAGAHEKAGHFSFAEHMHHRLLRICAALSYWRIHELMFNRQDGAVVWRELEACNSMFASIDEATLFIDELFGTFYGFYFLYQPLVPHPELDIGATRVERIRETHEPAAITAQCSVHGPRFKELYAALGDVATRFGYAPLTALSLYAVDCFPYTISEQCTDRGLVVPNPVSTIDIVPSPASTVEQRLRNGLRVLQSFRGSQEEYGSRTIKDWMELLGRSVPEFPDRYQEYVSRMEATDKVLMKLSLGWAEYLSVEFNPIAGLIAASSSSSACIVLDPALFINPDVSSEFEVTPIYKAGLEAIKRGNTLASFFPERHDFTGVSPHSIVFGLEPSASMLSAYLNGIGADGSMTNASDREAELLVRAVIAAAIYYESLRVAMANRWQLSCPMKHISWTILTERLRYRALTEDECCDAPYRLMNLWQAGLKAGLSPAAWKRPIGCRGCHSSDIDTR